MSPKTTDSSSSDYLSTSEEEHDVDMEVIQPLEVQNESSRESLGCSVERIPETDEDTFIEFSPFNEENVKYSCSLDEEGFMSLYDMYDLQPSFPLDG